MRDNRGRVWVHGQGTRMARQCAKCKRMKAIEGGSCQPGRPFKCRECIK